MTPTLLQRPGQRARDYLYWKFITMGAVRLGRQSILDVHEQWKGVRYGSKGKLELYRIGDDESEACDVAGRYPDAAARLESRMNAIRGPSELWPLPESGFPPMA